MTRRTISTSTMSDEPNVGESPEVLGAVRPADLDPHARNMCKEIGRILARIGDELNDSVTRQRDASTPHTRCHHIHLLGEKTRTLSSKLT